MQPDTNRLFFHSLIICLLFSLSQTCIPANRSLLVLRGEKTDCLIDIKQSVFIIDGKSRALPKINIEGNLFFYNNSLYSFSHNILKNLSDRNQYTININHILPEPVSHTSIQSLIHNKYLIIPTLTGFTVFNLEKNHVETSIEMKLDIVTQSIQLPDVAVSKTGVYLFLNNVLYHCPLNKTSPKKLFEATFSENTSILETQLLCNSTYCVIWFSEVDRGEIDSFRSHIVVLETATHKTVMDTTLPGVGKQPLLDKNNFLAIPFKKTSILSNLFSKDKQLFHRVNLNSHKIKQYSFEVSHKRRHLWEVYTDSGGEFIIQCKNGDIFKTEFENNTINQIGNQQFPYRYNNFIKGKHTGIFLDENKISYSSILF